MATGDEFGLSVAASGLNAAERTLTIWADNLANQSTPGFEASLPEPSTGPATPVTPTGWLPQGAVQPGATATPAGVLLAAAARNTTQGPLVATGQATDLALTVPGYFPVRTASGVALTRNGAFHRDAAGQLVSPGGGVLLDLALKPVVVPPGPFTIANGQVVAADGQVVAQLGIATVPNPDGLIDLGGSLLGTTTSSGAPTFTPALGQDIVQGRLEGANVSLPQAMTALVTASGQFAAMATVGRMAERLAQTTNNLAVLP
ncbi:MAG: flagellar hook-basal body protein [Actinomycetia bacterium]|nr:flagellar hook-basal body protein [Actinomycetes bacterium]